MFGCVLTHVCPGIISPSGPEAGVRLPILPYLGLDWLNEGRGYGVWGTKWGQVYWTYTSQWNMLEYPGVGFPVSVVDPKIDMKDTTYLPMNDQDKFNYDLYSPEQYADAPIGLQLVTRRFEDEKCLAILKVIEQAMGRP